MQPNGAVRSAARELQPEWSARDIRIRARACLFAHTGYWCFWALPRQRGDRAMSAYAVKAGRPADLIGGPSPTPKQT